MNELAHGTLLCTVKNFYWYLVLPLLLLMIILNNYQLLLITYNQVPKVIPHLAACCLS